MKTKQQNKVVLFDQEKVELMSRINFDADMVSLTDLWKEAGGVREKAPNFWLTQDSTKDFIEMAASILNATQNCIIKSKRGKGGGTYAHKNIALAYAKYLDPKLHVLVNEIFFQRVEEEKNPDLIVDRAIKSYKKIGKSDKWIKERLEGKISRNSFTSCLAKHGVETPKGFERCTNAIYEPMYGGGALLIREKKNISKSVNVRDNLSDIELQAVKFAEALAEDNIKRKGIYGENTCAAECHNSSRLVAQTIVKSREVKSAF